ncbi:WD repeat protein [Leptomonas pyrrhocoris]|uniref:WD repeat protein n=1 Tax=Leptomonas pyrrhocoris TaxID=157538 RepID=A0A0N0DR16_LEPPY|nr:WD repeat protein [Leptomonas pyrrhocoris]KPA73988.1 WD repeat protein [Leptomonas pyrrhocoris]|eukprot:XP_015652427.1 WD repeat protein [Leptomonas pyrrhocoris]
MTSVGSSSNRGIHNAVDSAAAGTGGNAMVTFFTTTYSKAMPEQTFSVPLNVLPDGLNQLVQSVLGVETQNFDFLYKDEYIGTTLLRFLQRRGISYEELLSIEYTPALQAKEGSLLPHDDWVSTVRAPYLGNAELLLTGAYDHCVRLWDGENCVALGSFHKEAVKEIALHPVAPSASSNSGQKANRKRTRLDGDFVFASASKDGSIAAWQLDSADSRMQLLGSIQAHTDGVDSVAISPGEGKLVATASWDTTVKIFNWSQMMEGDTVPSTKAPLVTFTDHSRAVLCSRFSAAFGAARLYSAGLDGHITCLDSEEAQLQSRHKGDHPINRLAVKPAEGSAGADLILSACTDNRARLYDTRQKEVVKTFSGPRQWLYSVAWLWDVQEGNAEHSGGSLFAMASEDATVRVYDLRSTNTALLTLDTMHTDGVLDVTYVGQSIIASCGKDNKTKSFALSQEELY